MRGFLEHSTTALVIVLAPLAAPAAAPVQDAQSFWAVRSTHAAPASSVEDVAAALKRGADVNAADSDGNTALMYSVMYGISQRAIIDTLLRAGADVNARNHLGKTALMFAIESHDADAAHIVDVFLAAGVDIRAKSQSGETAFDLSYASAGGLGGIPRALLKAGAQDTRPPCAKIVDACIDAGFPASGGEGESAGALRRLFHDCYEPTVFGGARERRVAVDAATVLACRQEEAADD